MFLYTTRGFEDTKIENVIELPEFNSVFKEALEAFFNSNNFEKQNHNFLEKLKAIEKNKENYVEFFMKLLQKIADKENLKQEEKNIFKLLIGKPSFRVVFDAKLSSNKDNIKDKLKEGDTINSIFDELLKLDTILSYLKYAIGRELVNIMGEEYEIKHFFGNNSFLEVQGNGKWGIIPSSLLLENNKTEIDEYLNFGENDYLSCTKVYGNHCFFLISPKTGELKKKKYKLYEVGNKKSLFVINEPIFRLKSIISKQDSREKGAYFVKEENGNTVVYLLSENGFQKMILEGVKKEDIQEIFYKGGYLKGYSYEGGDFYIIYYMEKKSFLGLNNKSKKETKFEPQEYAEYKLSN